MEMRDYLRRLVQIPLKAAEVVLSEEKDREHVRISCIEEEKVGVGIGDDVEILTADGMSYRAGQNGCALLRTIEALIQFIAIMQIFNALVCVFLYLCYRWVL